MTDTGGRSAFDAGVKRRVKKELQMEVRVPGGGGSGGAGAAKESKKNGQRSAVVPANISVLRTVWLTLNADGRLQKAFSDSGIIEFLKRLAVFVELSSDGGIEAVRKRFEVEAESGLLRLQRVIRKEVSAAVTGQSESLEKAAAKSFHNGSIEWAKELVGVADPLRVKVGKLTEAAAHNTDQALILSPTFILKEYGRRLVEGAIPGGDATRQIVARAQKRFEQQFEAFMNDHNNADEWRSDTLAATVKEFQNLLPLLE
jgi:hypothetical protein